MVQKHPEHCAALTLANHLAYELVRLAARAACCCSRPCRLACHVCGPRAVNDIFPTDLAPAAPIGVNWHVPSQAGRASPAPFEACSPTEARSARTQGQMEPSSDEEESRPRIRPANGKPQATPEQAAAKAAADAKAAKDFAMAEDLGLLIPKKKCPLLAAEGEEGPPCWVRSHAPSVSHVRCSQHKAKDSAMAEDLRLFIPKKKCPILARSSTSRRGAPHEEDHPWLPLS